LTVELPLPGGVSDKLVLSLLRAMKCLFSKQVFDTISPVAPTMRLNGSELCQILPQTITLLCDASIRESNPRQNSLRKSTSNHSTPPSTPNRNRLGSARAPSGVIEEENVLSKILIFSLQLLVCLDECFSDSVLCIFSVHNIYNDSESQCVFKSELG
jgi:hypothetical protein